MKQNIPIDPKDINMVVREYYKQLYSHNCDNSDEMMDHLIEMMDHHNSPNMKQMLWPAL